MDITSSTTIKKLLVLALVIAGLYFGKEFFIPLTLGAVFATVFLPVCKWLENRRFPRWIACLLCIFILLLLVAGVCGLLTWQVSELASHADQIKERFLKMFSQAQQFIYSRIGVSNQEQNALLKQEQSQLTQTIATATSSIIGFLLGGVLVMVYIFLLLYYRGHIKTFMLKLAPPEQRDELGKVIVSAANVSQQYLVGLSKMIACLWVMYSIGFSIVGINNAVFFAILCGLLEIVPFVGNIAGTGITVLFSLAQGADMSMVLGIIVTYGTVQFLQSWILEPLVVGSQVKINAMATIVALIFGELIWGVPGIILSIPLIAMFKIFCDHVEPLKPYGFLIGETPAEKKESAWMKTLKIWWKQNFGKKKERI
jgi:predicted PurR-regulated permease PerM